MSRPGTCSRVLLVTVDSLRADARSVMPTVQDLGRTGTDVTDALAHGNWTPFSFPSILGPAPVFTTTEQLHVGPTTLAETLQASGVETVGINAANGFLTSYWGYDSGYDTFEPFMNGGSRATEWLAHHPTVQSWVQLATHKMTRPFRPTDDRHAVDTSHLLAAEDRARDALVDCEGPQFLWLHLMDTHTPYVPAPRYLDEEDAAGGLITLLAQQVKAGLGREVGERDVESLRTRYDAAARQVDASLDRLLTALSAAGLREETCVIIAGDHGEEFMEHGHLAHYPKLYRELIEVPLIIDHPDGVATTVAQPVGLDAIPATICDIFGLPTSRFAGESLLPTVLTGERPDPTPVTSVTVRGSKVTEQPIPRTPAQGELLVSVRTDRWTYIYHTESDTRELYDRENDPAEQQSVWDEYASTEVTDELHTVVHTRVTDILDSESESASPRNEPPETVEKRLSHLGYS